MAGLGKKPLKRSVDKPVAKRGGVEGLKRVLEGLGGEGNWWKPKIGKNVIRILPGKDESDFYYHSILHYGFKDDEGGRAYPCFGAFNKKCPVCRLIARHSADQDPDVQDAVRRLQPRHSFLMNIVDRSNPDKGVLTYSAPKGVMNEIVSYLSDTDYGDVTDVEEGYDIKIDRTGEGLKTRYSVRIAAKPSPVGIDDWEEALSDLAGKAYREVPTEKVYLQLLEDNFGEILDIGALSAEKTKKKITKIEEEEELEDDGGLDDDDEE